MDWISWAQKVRPMIVKAAASLDDHDISVAPTLCDCLRNNGQIIQAGTRINWHGTIKRAAVTLFDNEQSTPDVAPNLWEDISYRNGYRIIPNVITSGLAFQKGEHGWRNDILYESTIDSNVWTPDEFPSAWKKVPLNV